MAFTAKQLGEWLDAEVSGPADRPVIGVESLDRAAPEQLTFVRDAGYVGAWSRSNSLVTVVARDVELPDDPERSILRVSDVDEAVAAVLGWFAPRGPGPQPGVAASAVVDPAASIGSRTAVGPHCVIGAGAVIEDGAVLHGHVTVMDDARIGADSEMFPGVVIRERCAVGARCLLHPNVVVGADGFGFRADASGPAKIPHIGTVSIGADVEIGAASCLDRAKFAATEVGARTKIDNLCQIAHNCRIGRACLLAGQVGLAGSVTIGDGAVLGGKVSVKEQLTVGAGARLAACSSVIDDVPPGASWGGTPARDVQTALREHAALRKLPELVRWFKRQRTADPSG